MHLLDVPVLLAASFLAGAINSIAGGGSLLSFPALLFLGRDPVLANATNSVSLWPGSIAGAVGFRREIAGLARPAALLSLPSAVGALAGGMLLLSTPSEVFARIVPWLILSATLAFAAQQQVARVLARRSVLRRTGAEGRVPLVPLAERDPGLDPAAVTVGAGALLFQLLVSVYGGYFGAGMGIVMLAGLGFLGFTDVHQANGLKNVLAFVINAVAAVLFIASGAVDWTDAAVMTVGSIAGGHLGASLARRLGRIFVQRVVIATGVIATVATLGYLRRG